MTLKELQIGKSAVVDTVGGSGALRQHFLDMGLIPGAEVTLVKLAPMGDPMELRIHGYELTLRLDDAAQIGITPTEKAPAISAAPADDKMVDHPGLGEGGKYHIKKGENPLPEGRTLTFALAGNQNCGKTTLFNQLTGSNQHVGNFPGVTVDRKSGAIKDHPETEVTDLPGIYSMSPYSSEEIVTRQFIIGEKPTGIINIVDATNIERNLYLTMQLMELDIPMVLALNMMDEMRGNGGTVRINKMEAMLGIPVIPISAAKNEGVDELVDHAVHVAMKVSGVSIAVNLLLSLFKLLAGILAHSGAMISDAIHSASDVGSTFVVIVGVNLSSKKSDKEHQYGHERMECVSSIILSGLLLATGIGIGMNGIENIIKSTSGASIAIPGTLALIAAVVSIVVKEWMFWYTRSAAKKINSGALMADAWHHRSDAMSSVGAFIGILGARLGFPILDPLASVAICVLIVKASVDIFRDAIDKMVDHSCDEATEESMREVIMGVKGVKGIDLLQTRLFGSKMYVDIEISADGEIPLNEAHDVAENVHHTIEKNFKDVKHCMVHVNPVNE